MKRRHHTIPRSYLQRFANERDQLLRTPLAEPGASHLISLNDASVRRDFYIVEDPTGTKSDRIEDLLGTIEGEGAAGLRRLVDEEEWPVSLETRERIAMWTALLSLRTPSVRSVIDQIADQIFKLDVAVKGQEGIRQALKHQFRREPTSDEVEEAWRLVQRFDSYKLVAHPNEHILLMLNGLEGFTRVMMARTWFVFRFQRKSLLTCDAPVVLKSGQDHPEWMGVGLLTADEIVVPIDRRVALVMGEIPLDISHAGYGAADVLARGTSKVAASINDGVINNAREVIFSHPGDRSLLDRELPRPRSQEVGEIDFEDWVAVGKRMRPQTTDDSFTPTDG